MSEKICPINAFPCTKERCGWWNDDCDACAVVGIAKGLLPVRYEAVPHFSDLDLTKIKVGGEKP